MIGDDVVCHARDARSYLPHAMPPWSKLETPLTREGTEIGDGFTFVARQAARPPSSSSCEPATKQSMVLLLHATAAAWVPGVRHQILTTALHSIAK
jgi:hypothetical protein